MGTASEQSLREILAELESHTLPTGAATEATLATLATEAKLELVRLLLASIDSKDFATQTTLAALLTELEKKADLTETQPVSAASLPLPTGAATEAKQDTMITALQLIDDLSNALASVATDDLRVAPGTNPLTVQASGGDKLLSFESIVEEGVANENLPAGPTSVDGSAVGAGKVWKVTCIGGMYVGTVPGDLYLQVIGLAGDIVLLHEPSPVSGEWIVWNGEVYLQAGDYVRLLILNATAGDDAYLRYAGVQMDAP